MATDAPGLRSVMETVAESKKKNLGVCAGFCWRYHPGMRETFQRLKDGAIGQILANYNTYNGGAVDRYPKFNRENTPRDLEWQLRRWYYFTWLSGDSIVEQGLPQHRQDGVGHGRQAADQMRRPWRAPGPLRRGLRQYLRPLRDRVRLRGRRARLPFQPADQSHRRVQHRHVLSVSEGICDINGSLKQWVIKDLKGNVKWRYAAGNEDMYQIEHNEFFASIREGKPLNDGDRMASSTLLAIMGRMAAYTGQEISWDMALNSKEHLVPETFDLDMTLPVAPVALPGITQFS